MNNQTKHWNYPHESPTKFNQIYTACQKYVDLREISYQENEITCKKCHQLMIEFESPEYEL